MRPPWQTRHLWSARARPRTAQFAQRRAGSAGGTRTDHALAECIREHYHWTSLYNQGLGAVEKFRATLGGAANTDDYRQNVGVAYYADARHVNNHLTVMEPVAAGCHQ